MAERYDWERERDRERGASRGDWDRGRDLDRENRRGGEGRYEEYGHDYRGRENERNYGNQDRPADFGDRGDWGRQGTWGTFGNRPDFNRESNWRNSSASGSYSGSAGYGGNNSGSYGGGTGSFTGGMGSYGEHGRFAGRGPKNWQRSDDRIRDDINERLTDHPYIDAYDVEIQVKNGEVTITGSVEDRQGKRIAEDIAESVGGVKEVHNQLRVQAQSNAQDQGAGMRTASAGTAKRT